MLGRVQRLFNCKAAPVQACRPASPALPRVPYKLVPNHDQDPHYYDNKDRPYTVLAIDGGAMRGMIPACVLEQVEVAIKSQAVNLLKDHPARFKELLAVQDLQGHAVDEESVKTCGACDFKVDLADYFDLISGTSTGAILASYFATKGAACETAFLRPTDTDTLLRYKEHIDDFKQKHDTDEFRPRSEKPHSLPGQPVVMTAAGAGPLATTDDGAGADIEPGSAAAAQALFAAVGSQIFTKRGGWKNPANWSLVPAGIRGKLGELEMLTKSLYIKEGVNDVLKSIFYNSSATGREDPTIKLSDEKCLHTSLLIPSFQIEQNRPVMFWHLHRPTSVWGSSWGYTTLNRLRPFHGLEDKHTADEAKVKFGLEVVTDENIVDNIATALGARLNMATEDVKPATPQQLVSAIQLAAGIDSFSPEVTDEVRKLSGEVAKDVHDSLPEGFEEIHIKAAIKGALMMPLVDVTFEEALSAQLQPLIRSDMKTTIYVLGKGGSSAPAEAAAAAAGPAPPDDAPERPSWLAAGAKGAGTLANSIYSAAHHTVSRAASLLHLHGATAVHGTDGAAAGGPGSAPESPPTSRFYEAESGDSLHVYNVDFDLWEVVRASTAAPTFFPAAFVKSRGIGKKPTLIKRGQKRQSLLQGHFADGGVVANNPTLAAIAFLEKAYGVDRRNIAVLSLGCGSVIGGLNINEAAGGLGWALPLISSVFMGSSIDTVTAIAEMAFTAASTGTSGY